MSSELNDALMKIDRKNWVKANDVDLKTIKGFGHIYAIILNIPLLGIIDHIIYIGKCTHRGYIKRIVDYLGSGTYYKLFKDNCSIFLEVSILFIKR